MAEPDDKPDKWMQTVHPKKGALHKQLGIPQSKKIPTSTLHSAASKGGKLGKRANLALRYRGLAYGGVVSGCDEDEKPMKRPRPRYGA